MNLGLTDALMSGRREVAALGIVCDWLWLEGMWPDRWVESDPGGEALYAKPGGLEPSSALYGMLLKATESS